MEQINEKLKIKWFEHFPVIGAIIYAMKIELYLNKIYLKDPEDKKIKAWRKGIRRYKSIFNMISLFIAIIFLVLFFVLRNKHGFGAYPWFFWVGLSWGITPNLTPFVSKLLYVLGYKKYLKELNSE